MSQRPSLKLLEKYLSGKATMHETELVEKWYNSVPGETSSGFQQQSNEIKERIYAGIIPELEFKKTIVPLYNKMWFRVAAMLLLVLGVSVFFFRSQSKPGAKLASIQPSKVTDVAPPTATQATITLSDGKVIVLNNTGDGKLANQGQVDVVKKGDDEIAYTSSTGASQEVGYNTLSVPRGSKPMKLLLSDGSAVWLNVASSIRYPTFFTGNERSVEITGEAYFEVAKNAKMPFIVKKANDDAEIKVLGTHFNVNSYDDNDQMNITLLEGSVFVSRQQQNCLLTPGQQAQVSSTKMQKVSDVDLKQVMAWKDGLFYFEGVNIQTIMKQVEKWYDVEVKYETEIPYTFVAKISRNVNASALLKLLELTEGVHFRIEKNKITVIK